jgi:hypothetical protein
MKQEPLKSKASGSSSNTSTSAIGSRSSSNCPTVPRRSRIDEIADDGPISHYVHPAGITSAPTMEQP